MEAAAPQALGRALPQPKREAAAASERSRRARRSAQAMAIAASEPRERDGQIGRCRHIEAIIGVNIFALLCLWASRGARARCGGRSEG